MTQFAFSSTSAKVCETDACKKLSRELKMIMDPDVHPCDDFSSYVCGNFKNLFPYGIEWVSTFKQMTLEIIFEIKKLLENQDFSNPDLPQAKAAIFYKSCLNIGKRNIETNPSITEFVNELTKEEDYKKNLISLLKSGLMSRIFSFNSIQDPRNHEYNILKIGKPNLILAEEILRSPEVYENEKKIERYKAFMENVFQTLGIWDANKNVIDGIVDLHVRLAKAFPITNERGESLLNGISINQLQERCKKVPWELLINGVLEKSNKQRKDDETFYIFSLDYVDVLCSVFEEYLTNPTKLKILKMDIQWAAIQSLIPHGSKELMDAKDKLNKVVIGNYYSWRKCFIITAVNFPDILGNMYSKNNFAVSKKKDIKSIIKTVRKAAKESMEKATWLDSESKSAALKKLKTMKYQIGYPDSSLSDDKLKKDSKNFSFHIDKFVENYINFASVKFTKLMNTIGEKRTDDVLEVSFHEVTAYYNYFNIMGFPAGILRYPFYDMDLPININYGGIGTVIGHEMMHGFDTDGVTPRLGYTIDLLSTNSKEEFNKRVKCMTDQYGQYKVYNEYVHPQINNDIADNSGLRMAYKALYLPDERREKMTLPGLDFTPEQLFFISNARSFCAAYTKNAAMENLNNGKHTYYKFRINGPMSNMPEFAEHFNCDNDKIMNPRKKCIVW